LGRERQFELGGRRDHAAWSQSGQKGSSRVPSNRLKAAIRGRLDRKPLRQAGEHLSTERLDSTACRAAGKVGTSP